jgi:hypothetical protein
MATKLNTKPLVAKPAQLLSLQELFVELKQRCTNLWCSYAVVDEHNVMHDGLVYKGPTPVLRALHNTAEEKLTEMLTVDRKAFAKDYERMTHGNADGEVTIPSEE